MLKMRRLTPVVVLALLVTSNTASFGDTKNRGEETKELVSSGIRSHGQPVRDWSPTSISTMDLVNALPNIGSDQNNGDDEWNNQIFKNQGKAKPAAVGSTSTSPISCHSSPCVTMGGVGKVITFIPVWVGTWSAADLAQWNNTFGALVNSYGSTKPVAHVFNTNVGYFSAGQAPSLKWLGQTATVIPLLAGTKNNCGLNTRTIVTGNLFCVSDSNVSTYISNYIKGSGAKVTDGSTPVYVYIGAKTTRLSSGFGNAYCGWHSYGTVGGTTQPFIAIQDYNSVKIQGCSVQKVSPNVGGSVSLDAMGSVLAHEIDETLTDPNVRTGWFDASGAENADKCGWTYGTTSLVNGARKNFQAVVGPTTYHFLIQQNWLADNKVTESGASTGTACSITG